MENDKLTLGIYGLIGGGLLLAAAWRLNQEARGQQRRPGSQIFFSALLGTVLSGLGVAALANSLTADRILYAVPFTAFYLGPILVPPALVLAGCLSLYRLAKRRLNINNLSLEATSNPTTKGWWLWRIAIAVTVLPAVVYSLTSLIFIASSWLKRR